RQSERRHVVVVKQIAAQRSDIFRWTAVFQADLVIAPCIVHESIDPTKLFRSEVNGFRTTLRKFEISGNESANSVALLQFVLQLCASRTIAVHDYWDRAFRRARPHDCGADSLRAAGNDHDLVFQLQVHALASK